MDLDQPHQFGTLFTNADRIIKRIHEDIAPKVAADAAYQNAKSNTPDAARLELDAALMRVINPPLQEQTRSSASSPRPVDRLTTAWIAPRRRGLRRKNRRATPQQDGPVNQ